MGFFTFFTTQTPEEYARELVVDAVASGAFKAVAVTALTEDGDLHAKHTVRGEGFVGQGLADWEETLAVYTGTHADYIAACAKGEPK